WRPTLDHRFPGSSASISTPSGRARPPRARSRGWGSGQPDLDHVTNVWPSLQSRDFADGNSVSYRAHPTPLLKGHALVHSGGRGPAEPRPSDARRIGPAVPASRFGCLPRASDVRVPPDPRTPVDLLRRQSLAAGALLD